MEERLLKKCLEVSSEMRRDALKMSLYAGNAGAHYGGGLSIIEILCVLYIAVMKIDADNPYNEFRDRFILSKGHGVLALYSALKQVGFIKEEDLLTFKTNNTFLYGHPSMNMDKGIEFSSGSLGQGLSLGVGCCIALQKKGNFESRVYVLMGDGECDEGAVWEAAAAASHYKLKQLVAIVDKNELQYDGNTRDVLSMEKLEDKWKSFGWDCMVIDGHKVEEIYDSLRTYHENPLVLIAQTIKGKGISFMENNPMWHHAVISKEQYDSALYELEGRK